MIKIIPDSSCERCKNLRTPRVRSNLSSGPFLTEHSIREQESSKELEEPKEENSEQVDDVDRILDNLHGVCPTCDKRFSNNAFLEKHVEKVHKRPYKCNLCSKSYKTPYHLKVHKKTHTEVHECVTCGLKFRRRLGLQRHQIRSHSTAEKKYICDYCGKQTRLKSDILMHISNAHSTNRDICDVCGRVVKYLKCHMRKHLQKHDPNKFACHLCRKQLTSQSKLDNHLLMHKEVFECQNCGEQCKGFMEMSRHKRLHRNNMEKCKICDKTFAKMTLRTHILSHAGLRPYKCDICDADFTQRSSLMRHRKGHPGPLPPLASVSIRQLVQNVLQNLS
ncbi:zinc finger protein 317-like [Harpegnathos saltator]|uniref:zinc finger protein 317-like n=1 Tax=Harpegnathos saltator TaxID=610380 RepID=UPI00058F0058|nr:zinc finger protein 317-like [Harpegnathos saltator]